MKDPRASFQPRDYVEFRMLASLCCAFPVLAAEVTLPSMLAEGTPAPPFTLPDQHGNPVSLSDLRGRWVVLWWYVRADTPG